MNDTAVNASATAAGPPQLTSAVVPLLRGVIYHDSDPRTWQVILGLHAAIRDFVAVLGLDLIVDEAEGYAFLRSRPESGDPVAPAQPRLIARRPLSFPVSLLLALLRKKLAEFDAGGGDTRLVLARDGIVELLRVFLPEGSNEAKLMDQIETHVNKIVELGFLRRLKAASGSSPHYEVRRILKAYVDGQWLAEFDAKLAAYRQQLSGAESVSDSNE
jgi:hypothetical protein